MAAVSSISVVIPVLHEEASIGRTLERLHHIAGDEKTQTILVDGDPAGSTLAAAPNHPAQPLVRLRAPRGRAAQMNAGAAVATGDALLFLHADTLLPEGGLAAMSRALESGEKAGAFELDMETDNRLLRWFILGARRRNRMTRTPYGDQAHFFRRDFFTELGGYPEQPIMEDVAMMRAIKRRGERIVILEEAVLTSPRRYEEGGVIRCAVRNNLLRLGYGLGVPPRLLAGFYATRKRS
jgi:rSAM/selenodomain-associated transferase 2